MDLSARFKEERGGVLIMAAAVVMVALLFMAFLLDLGRAWILRTRLQTAVDAAVLAAAQKARIDARIRSDPVYETKFFARGETLPPESDIKSRTAVWEEDSEGNRYLAGWEITYVKEYVDVLESVEVKLDPAEAQAEAIQVLWLNALSWASSEEDLIIPEIVADNVTESGTAVTYEIQARARLPSLLIGPVASLFNSNAPPYLDVNLRAESTVSLGGNGN